MVYEETFEDGEGLEDLVEVQFTLNGRKRKVSVEPRELLATVLRDRLGMTGTHIGCDTTNCGSCTVIQDGQSVKSCTVFAIQADGSDIITVEGIGNVTELHPIQEAFQEKHGLQCGFCTAGMIMQSYWILKQNPDPSESEIRWGISGNICRCTGYQNIVDAVRLAADKMKTKGGS